MPLTPAQIRDFAEKHRVVFRPSNSSWFLRACAVPLRWFGLLLLEDYWQTLGRTVFFPEGRLEQTSANPDSWGTDAELERHALTIEHEFVHVRQWERWWILFPILWAVFPVPVFLAWGRWYFEREAYRVQFNDGQPIEYLVEALSKYGRPWPKAWQRRWWREQSRKSQ